MINLSLACPPIALRISDAGPFLSLLHLFTIIIVSIYVILLQNVHSLVRTSPVNGISIHGGAESVLVHSMSPYVSTLSISLSCPLSFPCRMSLPRVIRPWRRLLQPSVSHPLLVPLTLDHATLAHHFLNLVISKSQIL